ncbi:helix-turn-helix domain-containing protein [Saccharomonospora sp. NPDC046836]|uniref:helix-turn-helix domain-containing protein n=1 Tax=Saccharomonospora sp. NPDC046836 TaxID=3156921 RepID=UPI00340AE2DE
MRDVLYLDRLEQAEALLKPQRIEILRALAVPSTCTEVANRLNQTPQRVNYHVKRLLEHDLVRQIAERKVRNVYEGIYQAAARSYWLSPQLVGQVGGRPTDALSLGRLLDIAEEIQRDIAAIDTTEDDVPSLGVTGQIYLSPEQRPAFLTELQETLQDLFTRYGGSAGEPFKLAVTCYPIREEES